ncbi:MAG: zinc ABC transporter substrate-binding protein [Desulfuromonadaceae bacterium]
MGMLFLGISVILPFTAIGATNSPGLNLVASVAPQEYLLNKLKTPDSTVTVVIQPGQNPTTWDPSPRRMQEIVSADILFPIGVPFEEIWLPRLRQRAPDLVIADTLDGIDHIELENHRHNGHGHHHGSIDPHIWLDPVRCIRMAENMTAALQQQDPEQHEFYAARLEDLRTELQQLHREIETTLAPLQQRTFMVFHPSWGYFAARYNLHQIALEKDGKEPSGMHLARLIEKAQQEQVKVIFVQQQFSTKAARAIAAQTGARIETLDPLRADLAESLRHTAQILARSLAP